MLWVEVDVGGCLHRFAERPARPIVCYLPAGEHTLVVSRHGRPILRERFWIGRGGSEVLTAWDEEGARLGVEDRSSRSSTPDAATKVAVVP